MQGQKDDEERGEDRDQEEGGWHPSRDEGHLSCLRNRDVPNTLYVRGLVPSLRCEENRPVKGGFLFGVVE